MEDRAKKTRSKFRKKLDKILPVATVIGALSMFVYDTWRDSKGGCNAACEGKLASLGDLLWGVSDLLFMLMGPAALVLLILTTLRATELILHRQRGLRLFAISIAGAIISLLAWWHVWGPIITN